MAAVELPDSPLSLASAVTSGSGGGREVVGGGVTGGRDSGVGGYWSVDGPGGRLVEESPSRAKERAARRSLMREADTLGIASVFSGEATARSLSSGTVGGVDGAAADGIDGGSLGGIAAAAAAAAAAHHPLRRSSLLSGERAVFKPVVNRIGSLELQVLAHHGAVENNVVKVDLPVIQAALNSLQLRLVATVVSEVLASPLPPVVLAMLKATGSSTGATGNQDWGSGRRSSAADGGGVAEGMEDDPVAPGSSHGRNWRGMRARAFMRPPPTVASSWATQRQADWETLEGKRWVKERIVPRAARLLPFLCFALSAMTPVFVRTRWCALCHLRRARVLCCRSMLASELLRKAVRLLKQKLQQRPNTHLALHLKRLKLELWRDESNAPFLRAEVRRVTADVMVYDDSSGSVDLQVGSLWASQVRGCGYNPAEAAAATTEQPPPPGPPSTPPSPTQAGSQGKKTPGLAAAAAQEEGEERGASDWWRAGEGGPADAARAGQQTLMALEVVKPLMRQDLERLSDQGNLRGWSPREITVHVQIQLGSPIGEVTLVRHFEAAVFPLVLHLRRSLFTDLSAFSSEAVAALSSAGAVDSGATQREEQIKASFLTSRKAKTKQGRSGLGRSRLRRSWKGKSSSATSSVTPGPPAAASAVGSGRGGRARSGSVGGYTATVDSASDVGDAGVDDLLESGRVSQHGSTAAAAVPGAKEDASTRDADEAGVMAKPMAVKHLRLGEVNVFLTYMGDRYLELEDVDNVHLKLHPLVYTNKTWTPRKLLFRMRRDVILDVLSQVSRNFNNLGNFLNTRVLKSGAATNTSSSTLMGTSAACRRPSSGGGAGAGISGLGKSNKQASPSAAAGGKTSGTGTVYLPDLLSETSGGGASRSMSLSPRPGRSLSLKGRKLLGRNPSATPRRATARAEAGRAGAAAAGVVEGVGATPPAECLRVCHRGSRGWRSRGRRGPAMGAAGG
ncbi:conserved unknown protein [Ectocarpus siliculosus]|uniref:Uncharacterized protein n=1 Tax=Ectocarpus siliculosus TaxID=2880 RepID=D7G7J9_ECTSI|nr:conserved unknown protein [Ectocarpus siliculosus]|eukprot:CBJ27738.1 conserved unknown protein [Ectocarpus siliculosus]